MRRMLTGRLPLVGRIRRAASLAEFYHSLALLLESGLPMPEALRRTGEGLQDSDIEASVRADGQPDRGGTVTFASLGKSEAGSSRVSSADDAGLKTSRACQRRCR